MAAAVLAVVAGGPLLVSGPGNDLDVANVYRSGRAIALHGEYLPSRAPGAPVLEVMVGVLDRVAGPLLVNLASLLAAVVLVVALDRLLALEGLGQSRRWALAILVANPWFVVAATSSVDYLYALALLAVAALALRQGHPVWAGLAAGASMGARIGSALLVAAILLAELTDDEKPQRFKTSAITAAVAAVTTMLVFVPSFRHAGGLSFAQNDFSTSGPLNMMGRAAVKDLMLLGPLATVALVAALPAMYAACRAWRGSWLVRFAVPGFVLSQILFVRFPWKMAHLLPCLMCLVVLLAVAQQDRIRLLAALVALQVLFGVVSLNLIEPNQANQATGGRVAPSLGWGPVIKDWQCRRDHRDAYRGRQKVEVEAAWNCSQPFDR